MSSRLLSGLGALAVALCVILVLVLSDDDATDTVTQIPPTQTVQPEVAVGEIVNQFVEALGTGDADALYAIQTDAYKQVCDRASFQAVADSLVAEPLEGPASVVVRGDVANAALFEVQEDGSRDRAVVPLIKQADGEWRLAAPSQTGCRP